MTATATASAPVQADTEVDHLVCCDDDTALCGFDVSGVVWGSTSVNECPLCFSLIDSPCSPGCTNHR